CEITVMAMFLSFYTGENMDKLTLAPKLRRDETPQTVVEGVVSFGDMHKGFVGSLDDRTKPGLGVYVEPLYELAKEYVDDVYDITGSRFEQVLHFVGQGSPVLVITPSNYNIVPQSMIQTWKTASGYMEVTFKEHSVLIVGYDEQYVYFNDPNTGRQNKQAIDAFQAGWEHQGSQALLVVHGTK
ncbi:MAG: C39 family peptidase, partial [Vallitaleaceae bacterium]|nr:C39 family peptidase [Vallitaleaceae bacterium]